MNKEYVVKIGKNFVKRSYAGSNRDYLAFGFTEDVNEAKRFYEKEPVEISQRVRRGRDHITRTQVVSNDGLDYANFISEQLNGEVFEVETKVTLKPQ